MGDVVEMRKRPPAEPADLALQRAIYRANMALLSAALQLLSLQMQSLASALKDVGKT